MPLRQKLNPIMGKNIPSLNFFNFHYKYLSFMKDQEMQSMSIESEVLLDEKQYNFGKALPIQLVCPYCNEETTTVIFLMQLLQLILFLACFPYFFFAGFLSFSGDFFKK